MKIVSSAADNPFFGRMVELNILGEQKICNFDCTYCSLGESKIRISRLKHDAIFNSIEDVISSVGRALGDAVKMNQALDTILIAGNGEPSMHPNFLELTKALIETRSEMSSTTNGAGRSTKLIVLTNGDHLDERDNLEAANLYDECIVKLDVGNEIAFRKMTRPLSRSSLEKIILGARSLKNLSIQTTITGDEFGLIHSTSLEEWIEVVAMLNPKNVYLQQAYAPCTDKKMKYASEDEVNRISHWLERRLKIKAQVGFGFAA